MRGGGDWVLVVDDDEDIRSVVRAVLEMHGIPTQGARDGLEALEVLGQHSRPALILLDLMMPRLDGLEFALALRSRPATRDIPIVVLSGDTAVRKAAERIGAERYLAKPVELDELMNAVSPYLSEHAPELPPA